jgi:putative transposase
MSTKCFDGVSVIPSVWAGAFEERKRGLRMLPKSGDYFVHVTSRSAGQLFLFQNQEKGFFVDLLRRWSAFSGIQVLTHCLMDNHFHLLLFVPRSEKVDHAEILQRLAFVWSEEKCQAWQGFYEAAVPEVQESMDDALRERMGDLPQFMRVLKQSFSAWFNATHERKGTLWDGRYRSVVVEGNPLALMSVAAYIDLNPLRAGLCDDPKNCPWSGYGDASSGNMASRVGLERLVRLSRGDVPVSAKQYRRKSLREEGRTTEEVGALMREEEQKRAEGTTWESVDGAYRIWLYATGKSQSDNPGARRKCRERKGFTAAEVVAEFEKQGENPVAERLQKRESVFTRGVGVGSGEFLQGLMEEHKSCFGPKRTKAGKTIKGGWLGMKSLRQVK